MLTFFYCYQHFRRSGQGRFAAARRARHVSVHGF